METEDAGNYTCAPPNIHPHSVIVNIMDTEGKYAAVSRDGNSENRLSTHASDTLLILVLFLLMI